MGLTMISCTTDGNYAERRPADGVSPAYDCAGAMPKPAGR
jgi:hypothetical protein